MVTRPSLKEGALVLINPGLSALAELYLFTKKHPVDRAREANGIFTPASVDAIPDQKVPSPLLSMP